MRPGALMVGLAVAVGSAGCEIQRTPDARGEGREVAMAERRYDPTAFDTVY